MAGYREHFASGEGLAREEAHAGSSTGNPSINGGNRCIMVVCQKAAADVRPVARFCRKNGSRKRVLRSWAVKAAKVRFAAMPGKLPWLAGITRYE